MIKPKIFTIRTDLKVHLILFSILAIFILFLAIKEIFYENGFGYLISFFAFVCINYFLMAIFETEISLFDEFMIISYPFLFIKREDRIYLKDMTKIIFHAGRGATGVHSFVVKWNSKSKRFYFQGGYAPLEELIRILKERGICVEDDDF